MGGGCDIIHTQPAAHALFHSLYTFLYQFQIIRLHAIRPLKNAFSVSCPGEKFFAGLINITLLL
jgi:hypothetical protein